VLRAFRILFESALDVGYVLAAKRYRARALPPAASRSPALGENDLHPFGGYDYILNYSHYVRPFICPFPIMKRLSNPIVDIFAVIRRVTGSSSSPIAEGPNSSGAWGHAVDPMLIAPCLDGALSAQL
jgi:hypothetical protein